MVVAVAAGNSGPGAQTIESPGRAPKVITAGASTNQHFVGAYVEARRAAGQPTDGLLAGLVAHLRDYGVGSVSETADGDPPHAATGCPFQAWSVAELLRVRGMLLRI